MIVFRFCLPASFLMAALAGVAVGQTTPSSYSSATIQAVISAGGRNGTFGGPQLSDSKSDSETTADPTKLISDLQQSFPLADASEDITVSAQPGKFSISMILVAKASNNCCNSFGNPDDYGTASSGANVVASFNDNITPSSKKSPTGTAMLVHAHLKLDGEMFGSARANGGPNSSVPSPSGFGYGALEVEGTGITEPPLPSLFTHNPSIPWLAYDEVDDPSLGEQLHQSSPPSVPITILLANQIEASLDYTITISGQAGAEGGWLKGDSGTAGFTAMFGHTLTWGGIDSVTNADTGEPITDFTVTSASGFDYSKAFPEVPEPSGFIDALAAIAVASICWRGAGAMRVS